MSYCTFSSTALNQSVKIAYVLVFSKTSVRIGLSDLRPRAQYETVDAVSINTVNSGDATCCLARSSIQLYLMPFHQSEGTHQGQKENPFILLLRGETGDSNEYARPPR